MRVGIIAIVLMVVGCAKHEPVVTSGRIDPAIAREVKDEGVSLAPVLRMQDLPAPPLAPSAAMGTIEAGLREGEEHLAVPTVLDPTSPRDAAFLRNEYLGNVRFGGGFIRTGDMALEVRARTIELGFEPAYVAQGTTWLTDVLPRALGRLRVPIGAPVPAAVSAGPNGGFPVPERRRIRGVDPEDGHDNINLPRTELVPQPLDEAQRAALAGTHWVLVPWLRLYYTHNGGWFLGQTWGTTGGARVEALVALYDTRSGRPVWWMAPSGRHIEPMKGQPSTAELDQYLLWAEQAAEEQLVRGWLQ